MPSITRKLSVLCVLAANLLLAAPAFTAPASGDKLPPWSEGFLDIHYINTGICESAFYILPDGTTMLVDAGAAYASARPPWGMKRVPDDSRQPGEWIARYISRVIPSLAKGRINYAIVTHFHGDHMGEIRKKYPKSSKKGPYIADGITEVAEYIPYDKLIDRAWPAYNEPEPLNRPVIANYRAFIKWQMENNGLLVERFKPGVKNQLVLLHSPEKYPHFSIRNLAVNGIVWTGEGEAVRRVIPERKDLPKSEKIEENNLSIAFRIDYGKFKFYAGGDLSYKNVLVAPTPEVQKWRDIETPVAQACGHVDVMKANHHGSHDANSVPFLRILSPRVIVIATRNPQQPFLSTHRRMISQDVWQGERDLFITNLVEPNRTFLKLPEKDFGHRHIVVRVHPGGDEYSVFQIDDSDENGRILSVHGPYQSK